MSTGEGVARCRIAVLAGALVLGAASAQAQDVWEALGPARIGSARTDVEGNVPLQCEAAACVPVAGALTRVAGVPVQYVELRFDAGRLAQVTIRLAEQHYAALLETLRQKLGRVRTAAEARRHGRSSGVFLWSRRGSGAGSMPGDHARSARLQDATGLSFGAREDRHAAWRRRT
jgi:hypothetical protein